jgi:DNA-binding beta-propeller fold protein YncE
MNHKQQLQYSLGIAIVLGAAFFGVQGLAQAPDPNGAPNPYRMEENWAKLPDGRRMGQTIGVEVDRDGRSVWVFDRCGGSECGNSNVAPIMKFDATGKFLTSFGAGLFNYPHGLGVDRDGNVYVTDERAKNGKGSFAMKFSPDGKPLITFGKPGMPGDGPDMLYGPSDIVVAANGDIYIADGHGGVTNDRIVKFSKDGKFIKAWGKHGKAQGELDTPHGIAINSTGRVFVADRVNIGAQARVVGQIPARMVRILIDDYFVGIPQPRVDIAYFPRCNAPIPAVEPKAAWTSAAQSPVMARTKSASIMAVFIGVVQVVMRIGVARKYFGFSDAVDKIMAGALDAMKNQGAVILDPADLESHGKFDDTELTVLLYELKTDLNAYLSNRPGAAIHSLEELIAFNEHNRDKEMPYFGQDLLIKAQTKGPLTDKEYLDALEANRRLSRKEGIDGAMDKFQLDAMVAPTGGPAWITDLVNGDHFTGGSSNAAAVAGYPAITVPAGMTFGLPVGISFFGRAWSEPVLLKLAYGFEQATKVRKRPQFLATAAL